MATEFISNSWLMPEQNNESKLSNYSLNFDGSGGVITFPTSVDLGLNSSISYWTNFTSPNVFIGENSYGSDYMVYSDGVNTYFRIKNAFVTFSGVAPATGQWHHIVFLRTGNDVEMYLNNVSQGTQTNASFGAYTTKFDAIGGKPNGANDIVGNITEVSAFDYVLSASQVTDLYGTGSAIGNPMSLTTKPVAYYPLGNAAFNGEFLATNNATELYENYALDFDGTDDFIDLGTDSSLDVFNGDFSVSLWFNHSNSTGGARAMIEIGASSYSAKMAITLGFTSNTGVGFAVGTTWLTNAGTGFNDGNWHHMVATRTGTTYKIYIDNTDITYITGGYSYTNANSIAKGNFGGNFGGKLSNISIYNSALSAAQVTTLYNSGKPFDLNTFAVTPVIWWRLGASGSSFDGTNWTILDEISTSGNNGTSANMTQADLVDGVGATGNGVSSGMSSGTNKVGNSPYSDNNSVSYNMSVTAKSTSVPT